MLVENFEGADHDARERYLREHAEELYAALTDDYATPLRLEELVYRAAERVPPQRPPPRHPRWPACSSPA